MTPAFSSPATYHGYPAHTCVPWAGAFPKIPCFTCRGDPSDEFRFATFFPEALHPVVDGIATVCSKIFRIGLQQPGSKAPSSHKPLPTGEPLPGSDATEAARRRYDKQGNHLPSTLHACGVVSAALQLGLGVRHVYACADPFHHCQCIRTQASCWYRDNVLLVRAVT